MGRALVGLMLTIMIVCGRPAFGVAEEDESAFKDLATGQDFRVRVAAALALGKSKAGGARAALEKALADSHPAVRAAAAAGLGALGDPAAIPALKKAMATETGASVKAQMETTINRLNGTAPPSAKALVAKPKFLVSLGKLDNKTPVKDSAISTALRASTRTKMSAVPGIEVVADGTDVATASKSRGLPAFTIDGTLTKLAKGGADGRVSFSARVEYLIRKMPEQSLKGTMSGNAEADVDARSVKGQTELAQLQIDAMSAAVESAMKGASPALEAANH